MIHKIITLVLIGLNFLTLKAQLQNPPDILWKSIKTEHFRLIFPSEIEADAQRVANTLEWSYKRNTDSMTIKPKPVPVILNSRSTQSNAFAALAPRRMYWYLTPPQSVTSLGNVEWVQTLSIHELRHIVQYAKNRQNFTKFMTILYGDMGQSMMRWSIPDWFFEGDAIVMETALTNGGRGRMPEFLMDVRTILLNDKKITYDQAYLGSYKRYYPSHYHLGYPLTAFARENFGTDTWDKVLNRTSKISFWPFAFGNSLKKHTGLNNAGLYKSTMNSLKSKWLTDSKNEVYTEIKTINKAKRKNHTNYYNPQFDGNGNIICIKQSLSEIPAFYKISPSGEEMKLKETDAGYFTVTGDKVLFDRSVPDLRWGEQDFSDLFELELNNGSERQISKKNKYFSPALSPDGKKIAVVKYDSNQQCKLCILDASSGNEIQSFTIGNNQFVSTPVWSENGETIAFAHSKFKGSALSTLEPENGKISNIIEAGFENIGRPAFYKHFILYNSNYSGIANIYAVNTLNGEKFRITSRPYGAYNAAISPDKSKIIFQDYSADGFNIAEMELDTMKWVKADQIIKTEMPFVRILVEQEGMQSIDNDTLIQKNYPVSESKKYKDPLKIHSWGLFPYEPFIEFSIYSRNYLNTLNAQAGFLYNTNDQTKTGYLGLNFARYFPVFSIVSSYGERKETYSLTEGLFTDNWLELRNTFEVSIPLNLSKNVYSNRLTIKSGISHSHVTNKSDLRYLDDAPNGNFVYLTSGINFSRSMYYAARDFNPKWAQVLAVDYKQIIASGNYEGYLFSGRTNLYFPGLFAQHSIKLGGSYEQQILFDENDYYYSYYFSSLSSFPRGYVAYTHEMIYKLSADYQFPLWYPDLSIGPLAYIKRIRAGAFIDYAKGKFGDYMAEYNSFGGSITMEFNILRYKYPLQVGVQYAYKPDAERDKGTISILILGLPF